MIRHQNGKNNNENKLEGRQILNEMELKYFDQKNNTNVYSILTFIDVPLVEGYWNGVVTGVDSEISGSLVSLNNWYSKMPIREIITTSIHEHCYHWDCVHNYSYQYSNQSNNGGQIQLCPLCLYKLHYQLQNFDICQRYMQIYEQCVKLLFNDDLEWLQNIYKVVEYYQWKKQNQIE
ncbi:hypothetical protein PPERSA_09762 [Pseudocohnilembus persalinus]|uniref:Uncharacterized protein n=1 Tax=Pseudocohnilembus persalinus TaxID=266149 RepID=A0A0V0QTU1_PSEPJ|nr:hypothetical protein PPERSA_09762 [Pseudocohnilembus persalinus]|eukprot:KRX05622.1 hypothetical protein PPERSA_09762 [Pseudocohnilembus persalinus]